MNPYKIMVVDDEKFILDSIYDYFDNLNIYIFDNPVKALSELCNNYYDIIIADYKMPDINGFELLERAKNISSYKIGILLTAYTDKEIIQQFFNKNLIKKVIEKPLKLSIIKDVLDNSIKELKNSNI